MKALYRNILLIFLLVMPPVMAHAYVGPGAGLSAIGTIVAFIAAIFLLIMGFLWYPIKRLLKGKRMGSSKAAGNDHSEPETPVEKTNKYTQ